MMNNTKMKRKEEKTRKITKDGEGNQRKVEEKEMGKGIRRKRSRKKEM